MQIAALELVTRDVEAARRFYSVTLGLPLLESAPDALTVQAGATTLLFRRAPESAELGAYHLAFNIPENQFAASVAWLRERTPLVPDRCFVFASWEAEACYFADPDGNILELIARHTLVSSRREEPALLCVSEIGLVVESVPETVAALGLPVYKNASPTFTAVGDEDGLVIVVARGRTWFATDGRAAMPLPFTATLADGRTISSA